MNADRLLDVLEMRGLLGPAMIGNLRRQVEDAASPIPPTRILRLLVEAGHITEGQAKRLLREAATTKVKAEEPDTPSEPAKPAAQPAESDQDEDLGLAPIEEDDLGLKPLPGEDEDLGLAPLEEDQPAAPKKAAAKQKAVAPQKPAASPQPKTKPKPSQPAKPAEQPVQPAKKTPAKQAPRPAQPQTPRPAQQETPQAKKTAAAGSAGTAAPAKGKDAADPAAEPKRAKSSATAQPAREKPAARESVRDEPAPSPKTPKKPAGPAPLSDGLADLLGDELPDDEDLSAGTALMPTKPAKKGFWSLFKRSKSDKKTKAGGWDSPLILMGSGALILLILVGWLLVVYFSRGSANKLLEEAETNYREGKYTAAIQSYDKFADGFSSHPEASWARVRSGLAKLRLATKDEPGTKEALDAATQVLPTIVDEEAIDKAHTELAGILPPIAEGLAQKAKSAKAEEIREWVKLTDEALALVDNPSYLPTSAREGVQDRIQAIQKDLEGVKTILRRDERRDEAIAAIRKAVEEGDTEVAYKARDLLLEDYPKLESHADLQGAVLSITARMGEQVVTSVPTEAALTDDPHQPHRTIVLSATLGKALDDQGDQVLYLLTDGAVFAIRAGDGQVVWRRFVGFHPRTHVQAVSDDPGADAILLDGSRQELLRLKATDGKLVWRQRLGGPAFKVRRTSEHLVVAEDSGRVQLIDPETGGVVRLAVLPQAIATSVGTMDDPNALLVLGDHTNLYVLDAVSLACRNVIYVGHKPEGVRVPPAACLKHLLVFENTGIDFAVHVLAPEEDDAGWRIAQKPLRLDRNVLVDSLTIGPHVICLTDHGGFCVFEVNPADPGLPVRTVARSAGVTEDVVAGSMVYENGHLWVADVGLTRHRLNLSLGQTERVWVDHRGETFLEHLWYSNGAVFHARHLNGVRGVAVTALKIGGGAAADRSIAPVWVTDLAVPPAGPPLSDAANGRLLAVTVQGDVFPIDTATMQSGRSSQAVFRTPPSVPRFAAVDTVALSGGRSAIVSPKGRPRWLLFDPASNSSPFRTIDVDDPSAAMATLPVPLGDQVVIARDNGQVQLIDPATGRPDVLPFQPTLRPQQSIKWRGPCVLADGQQFAIADEEGNLYRIGVDAAVPKQLKAPGVGRAAGTIVSPLAVFGRSVFAVVAQGDKQALALFDSQDFQTTSSIALSGSWIQGPARVGDLLFLTTDEEGLMAFNETGEQLWSVPLAGALPVGPPIALDDGYLLATTDGVVRRLSAGEGLVSEFDSGEPIGAVPSIQGGSKKSLILSGNDGTIRVLPLPE